MTAFTRTWDGSYEASPPGTQAANLLDTRIHEVKVDVHERLVVEHSWGGDTEDGIHMFPAKTVTTRDAISTPLAGQLVVRSDTRSIDIYDGSDWIEFMAWTPGDMKMAAYNDAAVPGWLKADGSAVSRTTYADLFAVISDEFGVGDGSTTFNLPKMDGRLPIGIDSTDTDFDVMGETGGNKEKTIAEANLPAHVHAAGDIVADSDGAHTHDFEISGVGGADEALDDFEVTGADSPVAVNSNMIHSAGAHTHVTSGNSASTGGDTDLDVMNPTIVMQWYIKT